MEGTLKTQTTCRAFQDVELRLAVGRLRKHVACPMRGGGGAVRARKFFDGLSMPRGMVDLHQRFVHRDLGNLQAAVR